MARTEKVIEHGGRGATYRETEGFTVYELSTYPRGSVLAGQQRRQWIDHYATLEEAQKAHPDAELIGGTTYRAPSLSHLPDDAGY